MLHRETRYLSRKGGSRQRLLRRAALVLPVLLLVLLAVPRPRGAVAATLTVTAGGPYSGVPGQAIAMSGQAYGASCGTPAYTYSWSFGDGQTGFGQIVSHAYAAAGTFPVSLSVQDTCGDIGSVSTSATVSGSSTSGGCSGTSSFLVTLQASPTSGAVGSTVTFFASGQATTGANYFWTFGDGQTAVTQTASTTHLYSTAGTFTASVTESVNGQTGCGSALVTIGSGSTGGCTSASAFTVTLQASPTSPPVNSSVTFLASGQTINGASYVWTFGDGQTAITQTASTTHVYTTAGTYTASVTETINGQSGCGSTLVTVGGGTTGSTSIAVSTGGPYTGQPGQQVSFRGFAQTYNAGATITNYLWDFGDGTTGSGANVAHTYNQAGTYTAKLTATDSTGAVNIGTTTVTIGSGSSTTGGTSSATANGVTANTGGPYSGSANNPITFNGSASTTNAGATIVSYVWSFGDGTGGSGQTTSHTYSSNGNYTVALTVTDSTGAVVTATTTAGIGTGGGSTATGTRTVPLVTGCNNVALTFPDNTSMTTVVNAISPQSNLLSMWKLTDPSTSKFKGYFPNAAAASDLTSVNRLDAAFICVNGPATLTEPNG